MKTMLFIFPVLICLYCTNILPQTENFQAYQKNKINRDDNVNTYLHPMSNPILFTGGNYRCGEFGGDGWLYAIRNDSLFILNDTTMIETLIGPITGLNSGQTTTSISYSYDAGKMFLGTTGSVYSELYSVNLNTAATTFIGQINEQGLMAFDADCSGNIYSFDENDAFYQIDPNTGIATYIGSLNINVDSNIRVQFDFSTSILYLVDYDSTSSFEEFRSVDLNTGTTTLIAIIGSEPVTIFAIDGDCGLPVELTGFTGKVINGLVQLSWTTATETNNKGFNVERSQPAGGRQTPWSQPDSTGEVSPKGGTSDVKGQSGWEKIGFVGGNGTSTETHSYSFIDKNVIPGKYNYRLKQIDLNGSYTYSYEVEVKVDIPAGFALQQNYPNPFNPTTMIKYSIPSDQHVKMSVYNLLGQKVITLVDAKQKAGWHEINFNASGIAGGVYFYKLEAGSFLQTKKMILLK